MFIVTIIILLSFILVTHIQMLLMIIKYLRYRKLKKLVLKNDGKQTKGEIIGAEVYTSVGKNNSGGTITTKIYCIKTNLPIYERK